MRLVGLDVGQIPRIPNTPHVWIDVAAVIIIGTLIDPISIDDQLFALYQSVNGQFTRCL